jgi:hypothetical protein
MAFAGQLARRSVRQEFFGDYLNDAIVLPDTTGGGPVRRRGFHTVAKEAALWWFDLQYRTQESLALALDRPGTCSKNIAEGSV